MAIYMLKPIPVSGVSLNKNKVALTEVGQTEQLIATVLPADAEHREVVWSSSDTSIATVDSNGLVTCVVPGECVITVTTVEGGYTATCNVVIVADIYADFLLVGGGGGAAMQGGGGGAGGFIECCNYCLPSGSYSVVIGAGGGFVSDNQKIGENGGDSCFGDIIAYGGGASRYGNYGAVGCNGGSGGGGTGASSYCCAGGCGCAGQGNAGGCGCTFRGSGGGGGAGVAGGNGSTTGAGSGGNGKCSCISGACCWYAGGGGGFTGLSNSCCLKNGGLGGGGGAGYWSGSCLSCGNATYYGGGGGGLYNNLDGSTLYGCGYQGVFILRYPTACGYSVTGGTKYECNGYCIHCFTSNGTLVVN